MTREIEITSKELDKLVDLANQNNINYDYFEGVLQDNFIFYDVDDIRINRKSSKYMVVRERHLNEWSSDLVLTMTNSLEEVDEFKNRFEQ